MARTPYTEKPKDAQQVQVWFAPELLARIDDYAAKHQRSRAWVINSLMDSSLNRIESARKRRRAAKKKSPRS